LADEFCQSSSCPHKIFSYQIFPIQWKNWTHFCVLLIVNFSIFLFFVFYLFITCFLNLNLAWMKVNNKVANATLRSDQKYPIFWRLYLLSLYLLQTFGLFLCWGKEVRYCGLRAWGLQRLHQINY
jgi:hypothetical protein